LGLVQAVTGIPVGVDSPLHIKESAALEFMRRWNYDFFWSVLIEAAEFGTHATDMGHAEYAAGGVDRREPGDCPYKNPQQVLNFDPWETLGSKNKAELIQRFEAHYRTNCSRTPFGVNMTGIYVTLISGFIALFGWDMLLQAAGTDLQRFGDLAYRYAAWMQQYFDALAETDVPVVMVHDDIIWSSGPIFRQPGTASMPAQL
jgi:hypothetical protein